MTCKASQNRWNCSHPSPSLLQRIWTSWLASWEGDLLLLSHPCIILQWTYGIVCSHGCGDCCNCKARGQQKNLNQCFSFSTRYTAQSVQSMIDLYRATISSSQRTLLGLGFSLGTLDPPNGPHHNCAYFSSVKGQSNQFRLFEFSMKLIRFFWTITFRS